MDYSKLIYRIKEERATGELTSMLDTENPFVALADIMLKAKRPLDCKVSIRLLTSKTSVKIWQPPSSINEPEIIDMEMWVIDNDSSSVILKSRISTFLAGSDYHGGIAKESNHLYLGNTYMQVLSLVSKKIEDWTKGNIDVAKVLATYAARDPEHIFWDKTKDDKRVKGLSM